MSDRDRVATPRTHVNGFRPVLVREDIKNRLSGFRRDNGLTESHHERCLVTAALVLVLENEELRCRWMTELGSVLQIELASVLQRETAAFMPPAQPQPGSCKDAPKPGCAATPAI
jgi:hypothetical protein